MLVDARAISYFWLTYYPKKLGASSVYLMGLRDGDGNLLNGTPTYRLTVPADTPARDFWSVIAYSMKSKGFIEKVDRVGRSSRDQANMSINKDGSVDLYFSPKSPRGHEDNWVPTGEDFFVIFRFYGTGESVLNKLWVLANLEKLQ